MENYPFSSMIYLLNMFKQADTSNISKYVLNDQREKNYVILTYTALLRNSSYSLLSKFPRSVFVQMLGEGIAISTIPLHLLSFGASPLQVGLVSW
jgi:hypothetical protein